MEKMIPLKDAQFHLRELHERAEDYVITPFKALAQILKAAEGPDIVVEPGKYGHVLDLMVAGAISTMQEELDKNLAVLEGRVPGDEADPGKEAGHVG